MFNHEGCIRNRIGCSHSKPSIQESQKRMVGIEKGRLIPMRKNTFLEVHDMVIEINNFEFEGSDGHLILERFVSKKSEEREVMDDAPRLVYVSGRTEEAVISTTLERLNRKQVNHSRMEKKLKKRHLETL
jgi:hypothetical protein